MKFDYLILLMIFISFLSCSNDEKELEINIVTGINFTDDNGNGIGKVGNPNVTINSRISTYPNPGNGILNVQSLDSLLFTVWILEANKKTISADISFSTSDFRYQINEIPIETSTRFSATSNVITLDLTQFKTGYYRIIVVDSGGEPYVENIFIDNTKTGNEIIDFLAGEF